MARLGMSFPSLMTAGGGFSWAGTFISSHTLGVCVWSLWLHEIHSGSRRTSSAPCLPAEGPTAEGLAGSRGCLAPMGCRLNNADIHPRQALALLASEGGVG